MALKRSVLRIITTHGMFQPGDRVLVGVSGGPDSVALLHLLVQLASMFGISLAVAHLNHNLRGEASDHDAQFVAALAQRLQLALFSKKEDVHQYQRRRRLSLETAAREVRYTFFYNTLKHHGFDKIALGHQRDDNAEQVLMNLLRGSGPTGLAGIPPIRNNRIVRPLLDIPRRQILSFLTREKIAYVTDMSNIDKRHLRNRVRHELLPHLTANYNPRLGRALHQLATVCRAENRWIEQTIAPLFDEAVAKSEPDQILLSLAKVSAWDLAVQKRLFRRTINEISGDLQKITFAHIEAIASFLSPNKKWKSLDLPGRVRVHRTDDTLVFSRKRRSLRQIPPDRASNAGSNYSYSVVPPGDLFIEEIDLRLVMTWLTGKQIPRVFNKADPVTYLAGDHLINPMTIRNHQRGDRFSPLGLGGTQSVGRFLAGREKLKILPRRCPVMVSGGRIVAVIGYGIDEVVKIGPETKRVLKVEVLLA